MVYGKLNIFLSIFFILISVCVFAKEKVTDNAKLLSETERLKLNSLLESVSSKYDFDLVILTENDIGGLWLEDYAKDFFANNGFGKGQGRDGAIFIQVTGIREFEIITSGRGDDILNGTADSKLESDIEKYLSDNPYEAYQTFLLNWEKFLTLEAKGRSYNSIERYHFLFMAAVWLLSILVGFLTVNSWKSNMNTVNMQTQAEDYVVKGSLSFGESKDSFLYTTTNKSSRQSQGVRTGAGTSVSSSGMRSGGGGRKY